MTNTVRAHDSCGVAKVSPMKRFVAVLLIVVTVAAGCGKGGRDDSEPLAEDDSATSNEEEVALLAAESPVWTAGRFSTCLVGGE